MSKLTQEKLIVYLADLDYFCPGNRVAVPLGIGSIASYCKNIYGDDIDIYLFKNPDELIAEISQRPPHVLGCSYYMWNTNITFKMIEACKIISDQTITLIGGHNVARNTNYFKKILKIHQSLDIVVLDQGEKSFANIIDRILKNNFSHESIFSESIDGCAIRLNGSGEIDRGKIVSQGIDINSFPSPYLSGYFDKFLEDGFLPAFETTRGCPHQCTFCCAGIISCPLSVKDEKVVYEEILYISKRSTTKELLIVDANIGLMGERDLRISAFMLNLYKKTGFPRIPGYATTKHKTKTYIELMHNISEVTGFLYFALQTLTEEVLLNCQRKNIPLDMIEELVAISKKNNWPISVDLIFGLPGETLKSFLETFDKVLSLGIKAPDVYQLRMLQGTKIAELDREKYGYITKFRPIIGRQGEYNLIPGQKPVRVIEAEEIACQNNNFNFNDYLTMRSFGFISMLLVGKGAFTDTVFYLFSRGIKFTEIFKIIQENYHNYPRLQALFYEFKTYSEKELFDSEEELISQVTNNDNLWNDLIHGQGIFFRLCQGFSGYCLFEDIGILEDIKAIILKGVKNKLSIEDLADLDEALKHDKLYRVIQNKRAGKLVASEVKKEITADEIFDYEKWRFDDFKSSIKNYRLSAPVKKVYYMEKYEHFIAKVDEYVNFSGYVFYEKIIVWGPQNLRRLCRAVNN